MHETAEGDLGYLIWLLFDTSLLISGFTLGSIMMDLRQALGQTKQISRQWRHVRRRLQKGRQTQPTSNVLSPLFRQNGGASMLQLSNVKSIAEALSVMVDASALNTADASGLTALVQDSQQTGYSDAGVHAAAVYKSQGGDILDASQLSEARKK